MIGLLIGTRPEIIKMAPILRLLGKRKIPHLFIHSNQHYSVEMDAHIINDLGLRQPDYHLKVGSGSHATQTGKIMQRLEKICLREKPDVMLVHGDTNTTLGGALTAKKMQIKVAHVEAGLRSFDYKMPEEVNRTLVDRISDFLFAPTIIARENLIKEGISDKQIFVTGNTVVDALEQHSKLARKSNILTEHKLEKNKYLLATIHRPENVDSEKNLKKTIRLLENAVKLLGLNVIIPIHPRTKKQLEKFGIKLPDSWIVTNPLGYLDMIKIIKNARIIITDSGGIQEEAYVLRKPLITIRSSTERPETLSANFIVGLSQVKFNQALNQIKKNNLKWANEFGDGTASEKILAQLIKDE